MRNNVSYEGTTWTPLIEFKVIITDPCRTSVITAITVAGMETTLGETKDQDFTEAIDSAGTTHGATVCGDRQYELIDISTNIITVVAVVVAGDTAGTYKIRAFSTDENTEGSHNLRLRVTFKNYPLLDNENYPKAETNFALFIKQASCDCSLITWDNPT